MCALPCFAGKNLQAQYERWQPKAKYRMHLDPTVDDVKKLALSCRRNAKVLRPVSRSSPVNSCPWCQLICWP
jgi:hypothetical protein